MKTPPHFFYFLLRRITLLSVLPVCSLAGAEAVVSTTPTSPPTYTSASLALRDDPLPAPVADVAKPGAPPADTLAQWTVTSSGDASEYFTVRWINKQFVALGAKAIMTSPDGITWRNNAGNLTNSFLDVAGNGNTTAPIFVTIGLNGTIATSPDSKKWKAQPSPTALRIFSVFWYNGQFLALGDKGLILTSPDGVHWTVLANGGGDTYHHGTILGNSLIVAASEGIGFSANGLTWQRALRSNNRIVDVATNGKLGVAVGGTPDNFWTSPNGVVWSRANLGTAEQINAITWTGNQFVAAGGNGTILNSPDGTSWSLRTLGGNYGIEGIAGHDATFVAVTSGGLIFTNQTVTSVARPEISFAPGPAGSVPKLQFTTATVDAKIYYTEDGSPPTASSTPYTAPFPPAQAELIKVRAYKDGLAPSAVASADFTIPQENPNK